MPVQSEKGDEMIEMALEITYEIAQRFGFSNEDAYIIMWNVYDLHQWVNYDDLKLQAFRYAQRLVNGGC